MYKQTVIIADYYHSEHMKAYKQYIESKVTV